LSSIKSNQNSQTPLNSNPISCPELFLNFNSKLVVIQSRYPTQKLCQIM
jgi:hypothetical protein